MGGVKLAALMTDEVLSRRCRRASRDEEDWGSGKDVRPLTVGLRRF